MLFEQEEQIEKANFRFLGKEIKVVHFRDLPFKFLVCEGSQKMLQTNESVLRQITDFVNKLQNFEYEN